MGLIKAANAPANVVPFSMGDIEKAAKLILVRANQQAEQILMAAQEEAEELKKAAQAEGLAAGRKEGTAKGLEEGKKSGEAKALAENREKLTQVIKTLTSAMTELNASRRKLESDAQEEVIRLAIAIAERVTKRMGILDPQVVVENVKEAMKLVVHASDLRIAIHPSQRAILNDALPKLKMTWPELDHVQLVDDATLTPGGCRLFTKHGEIDGHLPVQLRRIALDLLPDPQEAGA